MRIGDDSCYSTIASTPMLSLGVALALLVRSRAAITVLRLLVPPPYTSSPLAVRIRLGAFCLLRRMVLTLYSNAYYYYR